MLRNKAQWCQEQRCAMSLGQLQAGAIWLISVLNLTDLDSTDLDGAFHWCPRLPVFGYKQI